MLAAVRICVRAADILLRLLYFVYTHLSARHTSRTFPERHQSFDVLFIRGVITRQMCLDLIEYVTVDDLNKDDKSRPREIHIYYKLIDKELDNKHNALM